jgi:MFS transporter, FSR family, fosmidomycin resistance protein
MANEPSENSGVLAASPPGKNRFIDQWGGKLAFFFTYLHLSHDLTTGLLAALLPFIRQDLELSYLQSGLLVSAYALTSGFSQLLGGWISDRINRSKSIALGLGGVGLCAIAVGFAPSYYVLLAILVILGIMAGFYHPSAISTVSTQFETQRRGRVVAMHMVGGSLGFGIGPILGAIISSHFSWRLSFILLGIPALIAVPLVLSQLRLPAPAKRLAATGSIQAAGQKPVGIWQVFRSAIGIISISVAMQLFTGPVMSFASLFLVDIHHLSAAAGSMWVTIIRMGSMAGGLFGGWLADKWGRRNTIFLTLALFGPAIFLVARLPYGIGLGAAFILFGWLMTMRETVMQTYLMDNTPPHLRATVIGIYFGFGQQGSSVIQPVAGDFMDSLGIANVFTGIAYISLTLSIVAVVLALKTFGLKSSRWTL